MLRIQLNIISNALKVLENEKDTVIIWNQANKGFTLVLYEKLEEFINSLDIKNRTFHKVIPSKQPQKLRFDIDFKQEWNEKQEVRERLIEQIIKCFKEQYDIDLQLKDILVFSGKNKP